MTSRWLSGLVGCLVAAGGAFAQSAPPPAAAPTDAPAGEAANAEPGEPIAPAVPAGSNLWFRGEYLLWKVNGASVPTLVGKIPTESAELIQTFVNSTISPLYGSGAGGISYDVQSGVRLETGCWLDDGRQWGLSAGFFQLEQGRQHFGVDSEAQQALGPVFFRDAAFSEEAILLEGVPGLREGTVSVDATQHLWGAEANALHALSPGNFFDHVELLAGFRYLQFSEGLLIQGTSRAIPGGALPCG